jgi:hypothetical protein
MAIILKANKVNLFVSFVLFVFWYHSPNFLVTPRMYVSVQDGELVISLCLPGELQVLLYAVMWYRAFFDFFSLCSQILNILSM